MSKKLKDKLQVTQNKCIRFRLKLQSREHILNEHFHKLNWLPINQRMKQCVTSAVLRFSRNKSPAYKNEVFGPGENMRINTKNSFHTKNNFLKLNHPFGKSRIGKRICFILDLLLGTEFQKFLRELEVLILSKTT